MYPKRWSSVLWVYYNLFQPVLHLAEKVLTADKLRRKWDSAASPYQRLVAAGGWAR